MTGVTKQLGVRDKYYPADTDFEAGELSGHGSNMLYVISNPTSEFWNFEHLDLS